MIGRRGSCAEIGVIATDDIPRGQCLAVIPRRVLLSCANCDIAGLVSQEKELMESATSSWLPLLIALAAECTKKVSINMFMADLCKFVKMGLSINLCDFCSCVLVLYACMT